MHSSARWKHNLHLPLDVVLQQVLVHGVKVVTAHVVVVVGHCVGELLAVRPVFHVIGLVAVVVVKVAFGREEAFWSTTFLRQMGSANVFAPFHCDSVMCAPLCAACVFTAVINK